MRITLLVVTFLTMVAASNAQTATALSPRQIDAFKTLKTRSEAAAAPYAAKLAVTVKKIYANMLSPREDPVLRKKLGAELHLYAVKLLDLKGESFRGALHILTPEQRGTIRDALAQPNAPGDIGELIERIFGLAK